MTDKTNIKREIGFKLAIERLERRFTIGYVAKQIHTTSGEIEKIELGRKHAHWRKYQQLLQLYRKKLNIELIDE